LNLTLRVEGPDASSETLSSLQDWIRRERLPDVIVQRQVQTPTSDEMGVDPTTLSVVLGAPAVVALVNSIHIWLRTRSPKLTVALKVGGDEVHITAHNIRNVDDAVNTVLDAFQKSR
jgi:Effector Associated Constant Component 1